jgi:D-3-phosphoglycerate dehydrogenase
MTVKKWSALITEVLHEDMVRILEGECEVRLNPHQRPFTVSELAGEIRGVDALLMTRDNASKEVIDSAKKLKVIARVGAGVDNVDLKEATKRGIMVVTAPGGNAESVSEMVFAQVLVLARRLEPAIASIRAGKWERQRFTGHELHGKTIGIIGFGDIGHRVGLKARVFGMKVLFTDPYVSANQVKDASATKVDLDTLLKESDFVSVNCVLTPKTRGLIGERELMLMKKSAFIINTARGPIITEKALYEALTKRYIAGAALDVFETEPPKADNPLLRLGNLLPTPHLGSFTEEALRNISVTCAEDVLRVLHGEKPLNLVNKEVLYGEQLASPRREDNKLV